MDLDELDEIRPAVYRAAMKLLSLQRLCRLDAVSLRHITAGLHPIGGVNLHQEVGLSRQEVTQTLNRMFHSVSQEIAGHVTVEPPEETCRLMFRLNDGSQSGFISAASLQTSLIALSADPLPVKYRALVAVAENSSGSVSRSGLKCLLQDLSQVPAAVQEDAMFGGVEAAVSSCFNEVSTPTTRGKHVLSWLQSEPRLLLWLPTLYRLSVSQDVRHTVRCHTCKTRPIIGLRYRCVKCVNVHLCHSCFLTVAHTAKHKRNHPVMEFCTQPTWRESLNSLVHSACHALLPRRSTQTHAQRRRVLMWAEPGETQDRAPPPSDAPTRLDAPAISHSPPPYDRDVAHDASVQLPSCSSSSKALQTDEETPIEQLMASVLLTEVRNLQRDKWLIEKQFQVWRLTVQSEQGILEDRCSDMEVTMETLREHNLRLQCSLTQTLSKMETQQHTSIKPPRVNPENLENMEDTENLEDTEKTEDMKNPTDTEDTENLEDTEKTEDMKNPTDTENLEDTEKTEDMKNLTDTEDTENLEDTEKMEDMEYPENLEDMEYPENPEDTEDTENLEDTEKTEDMKNPTDTEDTENLEDTEKTEDMKNPTDTEDTENLEDMENPEDMKNPTDTEDTENLEDMENPEDTGRENFTEEECQIPSPTMHQDTPRSHGSHNTEEHAGDGFLHPRIGQQEGSEEQTQEEGTCLSEEDNCGTCSSEELLLETVKRLKTVMETDRWRERHTSERKRTELMQAADQVGNSIHHLVDAVRTDRY